MQKQINNYKKDHLPPHLCWYRKGYNTQQALVSNRKNENDFR